MQGPNYFNGHYYAREKYNFSALEETFYRACERLIKKQQLIYLSIMLVFGIVITGSFFWIKNEERIAKEQARIILPLNQYTEVIWTCSAQALLNFIELRDEPFAQWEIREYAIAFRKILETCTPNLAAMWFSNE